MSTDGNDSKDGLSIDSYLSGLRGLHDIQSHLGVLQLQSAPVAVSATFLHPRFRQERVLVDELAHKLVTRITGFCSTRKEIREAKRQIQRHAYETAATDALSAKARKLFIRCQERTARSGEGGELLLYTLIEELLGAPILVSKMRLKTNTQMPVHGSDGIHVRWDSEKQRLVLILGESKLHKTLSSALSDAVKSISELAQNVDGKHEREIEIAHEYSDFDLASDEMRSELLDFLNPWEGGKTAEREERFAVLIGFDEETYSQLQSADRDLHEREFVSLYKAKMEPTVLKAATTLSKKGVHLQSVDLFFFPIPSVETFREHLNKHLHV